MISKYSHDLRPDTSHSDIIKDTLLDTFGIDGYDPLTKKITCTEGEVIIYDGSQPIEWSLFLSIIGLPSRPTLRSDSWKILELLKNFIGGFDLSDDVSFEKKFWQIFGIIIMVKLTIIPLFKLLTWPLRLIINAAKLKLEILYKLLHLLFSFGYTLVSFALLLISADAFRFSRSGYFFASLLGGLIAIALFLSILLLGIAFITGLILLSLIRSISFFFLSPLCYLRIAYAIPDIIFSFFNYKSEFISKLFSYTLLLVMIGLLTCVWAIVFPLIISTLTAYVPALVTMIAWITHIPALASISTVVNSVMTITSAFVLSTGIGIFITQMVLNISIFLGLQVTAASLALGVALALFVAPIGVCLSWITDNLSNYWAAWRQGGPITQLCSYIINSDPNIESNSQNEQSHDQVLSSSVRSLTKTHVDANNQALQYSYKLAGQIGDKTLVSLGSDERENFTYKKSHEDEDHLPASSLK